MNKNVIIGIVILVAALGTLMWSGSREKPLVYYGDTDVACLPNGHQSIAVHIHPNLSISVDGQEEGIPANVGINGACMAEIHTHDATGRLHIETPTQDRLESITLMDFFEVWDMEIEREGYILEIMQDGQVKSSIDEVELRDGTNIELTYSSEEGDAETDSAIEEEEGSEETPTENVISY